MDEWIREALLEEQGYVLCPLKGGYVICDADCLACETYIDFEKSMKLSE